MVNEHGVEGRERRRERRSGVTGGLVLIALGVIFFMQQFGNFTLHNWWALFILFPIVGNLGAILAVYRRSGRVDAAVLGAAASTLVLVAVMALFLFDLSWSIYWPLFLILPGLSMVLGGLPLYVDGVQRPSDIVRLTAGPQAIFLGLAVALLGLGFLSANLGWYDPASLLSRWWALCILVAAGGGLVSAILLYTHEGHVTPAVAFSLAAAVLVAAVGLVALLGLPWNLLAPIMLIAAGSTLLLSALGARKL